MKVTARQKEILLRFYGLYAEARKKPIHYSVVAKKLGISKWTAYDMMKVLEEKGLVKAVYEIKEERKDRGRSSVLFSPTSKAVEFVKQKIGNDIEREDRAFIKLKILNKLEHLEEEKDKGLLKKILKLLPKK